MINNELCRQNYMEKCQLSAFFFAEADTFLSLLHFLFEVQCSDENFRLLVSFAKLSWIASLAFAEQTIEVAQCVEAAGIANF